MRRLALPALALLVSGVVAYYQERLAKPAAKPGPEPVVMTRAAATGTALHEAKAASPAPGRAAVVFSRERTAPAAFSSPSRAKPAATDARPAASPAEPPPPLARVYGLVYDLVNKQPVAGARLEFVAPGQVPIAVATDAEGHYMTDLPVPYQTRGSVQAAAAGHRLGQLEDSDPPLRDLPDEQRREKALETTDAELAEQPFEVQSGTSMELNLVMLPADDPAAPAPEIPPLEEPAARGGTVFMARETISPATVLAVPSAPKTNGPNTVVIPPAKLGQ